MKIVINREYGGFGVSPIANYFLGTPSWPKAGDSEAWDARWKWERALRTNPVLLQMMEQWGPSVVNGESSSLEVVVIPDGVSWHITEYDGIETIREDHRSWPAYGGE